MPSTSPSFAPWRRTKTATLVIASVLVAVVTLLAGPAQGQDVTSTTVPSATTVPGTTAATDLDNETQTLVEAEPQQDRFLTAESRRIVAAIGGLVVVALMLMLLTVRYWRQTKPVPPAPTEPEVAPPATEEVAVVGRRSRRAIAGADHADVDESWEPLATGEHAMVDLPHSDRRPRPSIEARRKVLGQT